MKARVLFATSVALCLLGARSSAQDTTGSPHGDHALECGECHSPERWVPLPKARGFQHEKTGWRLEAAHATVSCRSCHKSLVFSQVGTACADCHKDVHKGELGQRCEACHTPKAWSNKAEMFQVHSRTRFPLFALHASLDCTACHKSQKPSEFANTPADCGSCHAQNFDQARNPNHALAGFSRRCEDCHGALSRTWRQTSYRHPEAYPLRGGHVGVRCVACHATGFKGTPRECVTCHRATFGAVKQPDHVAGGFSTDCTSCHRETGWRPASGVDHSRTRFPLTGAHTGVGCARCHAAGKFAGTPTDCDVCHASEYAKTRNPDHVGAGFPTTCQTCHVTAAWRPASSVNHNLTRFPLTGAHRGVECARCHTGGKFSGTPTSCVGCHQGTYARTASPNHAAAGFPTECQACHTTTGWRPASGLDHNRTRFPLTGAHQRLDCLSCHKGGKYSGLATECYACHQSNFAGTTNPKHVGGAFSTVCQTCHNTSAWRPAIGVDHNKTRFPLTGAHQRAACLSCHKGGTYAGTPTECYGCHQSNYQGTTNPNHVAAKFSTLCQSCHVTVAWRPASGVDHSKTRFPLTGAHQRVDCVSCHKNGKYTGTPTDCYACHQTDYTRTANPNHVTGGFPTQCQQCHQTTAWRPATGVDHNKTRFPLTGAHQRVDCASCHKNGKYAGTPTDCYACHQSNYVRTTNPNHVTSGFSTQCQSCHATSAWRPATGVDHSKTRFPLTGAHQRVDCASCHKNGKYAGTPTDCYACHQANYAQTTNPNHSASGYSTQCQTCHATSAWRPATGVDHNKTRFPLTGAHQRVDCASCHKNGKYAGTPTDCYACHQANYNATRNPNHAAAGFPTRCADCHATTGWKPANFNHDGQYFPINSGKHRGKWSSCADCHVNSGNYRVFECILCHEHNNKAEVDSKHKNKSGYAYQSTACYSCHPRP